MSAFAPLVGAKRTSISDCRKPTLFSGRGAAASGRRQARDHFRFPLNHHGIRARIPLGDHVFQDSERLLKLLVRQLLERIAVLDLVFARDKQGQTSQVHPGLLAAHLRNGLLPVLAEIA